MHLATWFRDYSTWKYKYQKSEGLAILFFSNSEICSFWKSSVYNEIIGKQNWNTYQHSNKLFGQSMRYSFETNIFISRLSVRGETQCICYWIKNGEKWTDIF